MPRQPSKAKGRTSKTAASKRWRPLEWAELVSGDDVPELPPGEWGRQASSLWDAVWSGPLRAELLPQHLEQLESLLELVELKGQVEPGDVRAALQVRQAIRLAGDNFGLTPMAMRKLRIDVTVKAPQSDDEANVTRLDEFKKQARKKA